MRRIIIALCVVMMSVEAAAALDIDAAKDRGLVGETRNGYLAPMSLSDEEARQLVDAINARRREEYKAIAQRNGQQLSVVERVAAAKAYELSKPGHYLKDAGGNWVRK